MRNFEEIKTKVELIMKRIIEEATVELSEIVKNNSVTRHAIIIRQPNNNVAPTIYVDDMEGDENKIANDVVKYYLSIKDNVPSFDVSDFIDFDKVKSKIVYLLVNLNNNGKVLKDVPYRKHNDLAIIYKVLIDNTSDVSIATARITNDLMSKWGVTENDLYELATENTPRLMPEKFDNMVKILADMMGIPLKTAMEMQGDMPMYVLSNEQKQFGATAIIYPDTLNKIADELENDEPRVILLNKDNFTEIQPVLDYEAFYMDEPTEKEFQDTVN